MAKIAKSVKFDGAVWAQIDAAAADRGVNRQAWFDQLVGRELGLEVVGVTRLEPGAFERVVRPRELADLGLRSEAFSGMRVPTPAGGVIGGRGKEAKS